MKCKTIRRKKAQKAQKFCQQMIFAPFRGK